MAGLTTHILDLTHGRPAAGVAVALLKRDESGALSEVTRSKTNADGRCAGPLIAPPEFETGYYQLDFYIGDYYRGLGVALAEPAFLDIVPVVFGVADASSHYHVPLLVSPYGYSTYRGS